MIEKIEKYLKEQNEFAMAGIANELNRLGIELANAKSKAKAKKAISEIEDIIATAKKMYKI